jgi:hypothetical protein
MKVREWYCDYDPRLFVGKVRLGQLGYTDFYLRNSNLHVSFALGYTMHTRGRRQLECQS